MAAPAYPHQQEFPPSSVRRSPALEPPAPIDLAAARTWLLAAPRDLAALPADRLADALAHIQRCYDEYPELEQAAPRAELIGELRSLAGSFGDPLAVPLLMAATILDTAAPPERVADLLLRMARSGHDGAIGEVLAVLAQGRPLAWAEIAPAADELFRPAHTTVALEIASRALDAIGDWDDGAATEFGAMLRRVLPGSDAFVAKPAAFIRTLASARRRVQSRMRPGPHARVVALPGGVPLGAPGLSAVELPRRLALHGRPPVVPMPERAGIVVEWLPSMQLGRAGERDSGVIAAKPGQAGHLVYGPYVQLEPGDYRVRVYWEAGRPSRMVARGQPVAAIEAVSRYGRLYLAQREFSPANCGGADHELRFRVGVRSAPAVEVRVWTGGALPLTVSSVTIERLDADKALPSPMPHSAAGSE